MSAFKYSARSRSMLRYVATASTLTIILAVGACFPLKQPQTCQVHLSSGGGGTLDVGVIDPDSKLPFKDQPLHVFWHPPIKGGGMDLVISYRSANLNALGTPTGGRTQFAPGIGSSASQFQALVSDGDAQVWRFGADTDFGSEQGDFIFSTNDPSGRAVISAIASGKTVKVVILKSGISVASASFNSSATSGRDRLLATARHIIETSNPRFCHPE